MLRKLRLILFHVISWCVYFLRSSGCNYRLKKTEGCGRNQRTLRAWPLHSPGQQHTASVLRAWAQRGSFLRQRVFQRNKHMCSIASSNTHHLNLRGPMFLSADKSETRKLQSTKEGSWSGWGELWISLLFMRQEIKAYLSRITFCLNNFIQSPGEYMDHT